MRLKSLILSVLFLATLLLAGCATTQATIVVSRIEDNLQYGVTVSLSGAGGQTWK